jgi:2-polyprenyl-3-methyl-5-hydroxy-6-metoxy-1,4-benzoquinol methylase
MPRQLERARFDEVFEDLVVHGQFNEVPEYYPRYRNRYWELMKVYASLTGPAPVSMLDIGGGQFAIMARALWNDECTVADLGGKNYDFLREHGVEPVEWNLYLNEQPFTNRFDMIIFSEVIEHVPLPGHVLLERLRLALRPGGRLICTTPNLHRARNVVYMIIGRQIFDLYMIPTEHGLGHFLEYSREHLDWHFHEAGFEDVSVQLRQFHHVPNSKLFRVLAWLGYPLFLYPRLRDNLVAVGRAPEVPIPVADRHNSGALVRQP